MKKKILVIEDDKVLLEILIKKLKQSNYLAIGAEDGEVGLKKIKKEKPDLVLLDILMPKKDGFEVMEEKNKDKDIKNIPIIIVSNSGQPVEIERAKKLGAKDFLIKAIFDPNEVLDKVNKVLKVKKMDGKANNASMPEKIKTEIVNNKNINNKLKNIKVLVVEDDEFLRQLVGRKLGDAGFDIKTAIDAQNAFNVLKDFKPDIILLDLILPGLDGFQILTKIKKDKSIADVPVIILSNLGQKEDVDKAMALGATDFLVKAYFTLDEIVKKIYNILDKK